MRALWKIDWGGGTPCIFVTFLHWKKKQRAESNWVFWCTFV